MLSGKHLASYEVLAKLGEGGMGEVYRARDSRLNRDVAIQILPELFATDPERRARFEREAQALAAVNHPNIAQVHGILDGPPTALVMELVEGEDLSARLARGRMPLDEALAIATQIAEALDAAHERGIVHRDLKPANIRIRHDDVVKVLDFGLAKSLDPRAAAEGVTPASVATLTSPAVTELGVVLGTAVYMAPEQAKGKTVDKRADIWAFGCLLYEMLTGRQAFKGDSVTDVIAAIVKEDPDWTALPHGTPVHVRRVLQRCLEKDPKKRIRDIGEARLQLEDPPVTGELPPASPSEAPPRRSIVLPWMIAGLCGAAALAVGVIGWTATTVPDADPLRFLVRSPNQSVGFVPHVLSPDGSFLVYQAERLYIQRFSSTFVPEPVAGTENASAPFVSPDGKWIGFYADGRIKKVAVAGGNPIVVTDADADSPGAAWGPDNRIYFSPAWSDSALMAVSSDGGTPTVVSALNRQDGERGHWWPHPLPDGRHVLFTIWQAGAGLADARVAVLDLQTGQHRVLFPGAIPRYAAGHLLYYRAGRYVVVPFDLDGFKATGEPEVVLVDALGVPPQGNRLRPVSLADNGTVAYLEGDLAPELELTWIAGDGRREAAGRKIRAFEYADLSPDGRRVAWSRLEAGTAQIWITDLVGTGDQRLSSAGLTLHPVWHPDGRRLAFLSMRKGDFDMFLQRLDGAPEQPLETDTIDASPHGWFPDGKRLLGKDWRPDGTTSIFQLDPADGSRSTLVAGSFRKERPAVSPDGKWLALLGNPSGEWRIHLQPLIGERSFRSLSTTDVDSEGNLKWSPKGDALFVRRRADLVRVLLGEHDGALEVKEEQVLAGLPEGSALVGVSPDGQRALVGLPTKPAAMSIDGIRVIINGLETLVGNNRRD